MNRFRVVTVPLHLSCIVDTMNPTDAAAIAEELAAHLRHLARLDAYPRTNALVIEAVRREAKDCADQLAGFLVMSDTFGGL